jgi:dextranase
LSGIQFYDWAYRHADLLGGGDTYLDALDQPISQKTVKKLVSGVQSIGSAALGYAAVYAVGLNEWNLWNHNALLTAEGVPYSLGDFLFIVDPASPDWLEHFTEDLSAASESIGFDGFHLDQYGYPKNARRADGVAVDVANSFIKVIESARKSLPNSRLIFNNVNDFPTWKTAQTSQNAVYIEVWPPHVTLNSLAAVVNRAKHLSGDKPVVIAAYQHVYDGASATESDLATKFTMATLFSHGATQLLAGEADRILVDPYYVRNHQTAFSTQNMLRSWYDFLVEHDQILMSPDIVDVTGSFVGPYNDDCDVSFKDVRVNDYAEPGIIWRRIVKTKEQLVIHLINTLGQENVLWDAPRNSPQDPGNSIIRIRLIKDQVPRVRVASPDGTPRLVELDVTIKGNYVQAELPSFEIWQIIVIDAPRDLEEGNVHE